jgi:type III pantothenate kinase
LDLIIDRGNTRIKWCVYDGNQAIEAGAKGYLTDDEIQNLLIHFKVDRAIVSTVAGLHFSLNRLFKLDSIIWLSAQTPLPYKNNYETPETLGKDRLAAVAGAQALWPDKNLMVIDTGTCITIDFLDNNGNYLGGNICPGPELRYYAMNEHTDALPLVERNTDGFNLIGQNTTEALQNGGISACVVELEGWIDRSREQFEDLHVVISGGDAQQFAENMKKRIFVREDLVMLGLKEILNFNANQL